MEEVIYYLELKNQFYEKFFSMTQKFLVQIEQNRWDGLELFTDNRERILNIIRSYDSKIAFLFESIQNDAPTVEAYRAKVRELLDKRANVGSRIIAQDLELMSKMEDVRNETIRDLKKVVETNQALESFVPVHLPRKGTKATKDA